MQISQIAKFEVKTHFVRTGHYLWSLCETGRQNVRALSVRHVGLIIFQLVAEMRKVCDGVLDEMRNVCRCVADEMRKVCAGVVDEMRKMCAGVADEMRKVCACVAGEMRKVCG